MVKIENKKKGEEKKIKLYNKIGEEARVILSIRENGRKTGIILYINVFELRIKEESNNK